MRLLLNLSGHTRMHKVADDYHIDMSRDTYIIPDEYSHISVELLFDGYIKINGILYKCKDPYPEHPVSYPDLSVFKKVKRDVYFHPVCIDQCGFKPIATFDQLCDTSGGDVDENGIIFLISHARIIGSKIDLIVVGRARLAHWIMRGIEVPGEAIPMKVVSKGHSILILLSDGGLIYQSRTISVGGLREYIKTAKLHYPNADPPLSIGINGELALVRYPDGMYQCMDEVGEFSKRDGWVDYASMSLVSSGHMTKSARH